MFAVTPLTLLVNVFVVVEKARVLLVINGVVPNGTPLIPIDSVLPPVMILALDITLLVALTPLTVVVSMFPLSVVVSELMILAIADDTPFTIVRNVLVVVARVLVVLLASKVEKLPITALVMVALVAVRLVKVELVAFKVLALIVPVEVTFPVVVANTKIFVVVPFIPLIPFVPVAPVNPVRPCIP